MQAPVYLVDNFGAAIPSADIDVPLALDSVIDDNGINVQTEYVFDPYPFPGPIVQQPVFSFEHFHLISLELPLLPYQGL